MTKRDATPLDEGMLAASMGRSPKANPYPPNSDEREERAAGYEYARVADEDGKGWWN